MRAAGCRVINARRGFNLVELLMALAITAALLTATLVALNASYTAYQHTTRAASTHTISRLSMDRMLTLIRTGQEFGPYPDNPNNPIVKSDVIDIVTAPDDGGDRQGITLEWDEDDEALYVQLFDPDTGTPGTKHLLLEGVVAQYDEDNVRIKPFTLEFERGRFLYRATIDLTVIPDDNLSVQIEGSRPYLLRLVATTMPRTTRHRLE